MNFLCTKVKSDWLSMPSHIEQVRSLGIEIKSPFIGININAETPTEEEFKTVDNAVNVLFGNHKKAFPIRVIKL